MGRLGLVIADPDNDYTEALVNYLMAHHSDRFRIGSFTVQSCLEAFLSSEEPLPEILLINPVMWNEKICSYGIGTVIMLVDGKSYAKLNNCTAINKYQHGERLVGEVISVFSRTTPGEVRAEGAAGKTKIAAFYSPAGGSGKTCIAAGLCMQYVHRTQRAFYLNFEHVHSTPLLFDCQPEHSLSRVFYYLKENKNLALKLDGVKCIDPRHNVHYFCPPDHAAEMEEAQPEELRRLLSEFKSTGRYHLVAVDMSGSLDRRNAAILESSDRIFLVVTQDAVAVQKAKRMAAEIALLSQTPGAEIMDKVIIVLNRYRKGRLFDAESLDIGGRPVSVAIPDYGEFMAAADPAQAIGSGSEFGRSVSKLMEYL